MSLALQEFTQLVSSKLRQHDKLLIVAYPGFGKSRAIPHIAKRLLIEHNVEKVLILTRSVVEIAQLVKFMSDVVHPEDVGVLIGREKICPYGARTSFECSLLRSDGVCKLERVRASREVKVRLHLMAIEEIRNFALRNFLCPYDVLYAKCRQAKIALTTFSYLSNRELYRSLLDLVKETRFGLIVDEAHNIVAGIETYHEIPVQTAIKLAQRYSKFFRDITQLEEGEALILQQPEIDIEKLRVHGEIDRDTVRYITLLLNYIYGDLIQIRRCSSNFEFRVYTLSTVLDIVRRCSKCVMLTASITRKFIGVIPGLRDFHVLSFESTPSYFNNLRVVVLTGVEFTKKFRETKRARSLILKVISRVLRECPLVGGVAILFSSREFLKTCLEDVRDLLEKLHEDYMVLESSNEVDHVISTFKRRATQRRTILLTYAGSPTMEGINFLKDELVMIILFGFPYPEFSTWNEAKRQLLRGFTSGTFKCVYLFPAISLTIQVVGRLTRDLDVRVKQAFLVDSRFLKFRDYFPSWMCSRMEVYMVQHYVKTFG